jgi:hypothetical protein
MKPLATEQRIADRVAETLNLIHDFEPIRPTKRELTKNRKGETYDADKEKERDISMITRIPRSLVFISAWSKALDITHPCEARTATLEQYLRSARSEKGWWADKAEAMMKAVRPISEDEQSKGRIKRFFSWAKGS